MSQSDGDYADATAWAAAHPAQWRRLVATADAIDAGANTLPALAKALGIRRDAAAARVAALRAKGFGVVRTRGPSTGRRGAPPWVYSISSRPLVN